MYKFSIGRASSNDIAVPDPTVSSIHAVLEIDDRGGVYIEDKNSKNGTFVNGKKIQGRCKLNSGDTVKLARYVFNWESHLRGASSGSAPAAHAADMQPPQKSGSNNTIWILSGLGILLVGVLVFLFATPAGKKTLDKVMGKDSGSSKEMAKQRRVRNYDLSCLNEGTGTDEMIKTGNDLEDEVINSTTKPFSMEDEMKVGDEVYKQVADQYEFVKDPKREARVNRIFNKLMNVLGDSAKGFRYVKYIIASDEINAFTAGGKIFITTGIMDFAKSDDELACIIGHEMYHNELGHINKALRKDAALKKIFGDDLAQWAALAAGIFTASFNQDEETNCDLHGLDLAMDAGYQGCAIIPFWERMSENESEDDAQKFFRTHPYSKQRSSCIDNHVRKNYDKPCPVSAN